MQRRVKTFFRMIHVVDWLPTLLTAVKDELKSLDRKVVDSFTLKGIDGMDQWNMLTNDVPSNRREFIYNIDLIFDDFFGDVSDKSRGNAGIRYNYNT